MIKRSATTTNTALVTFELPAVVAAGTASVCGEFNNWSSEALPMARTTDGRWEASVILGAGRRWRFRYLLDGTRWENDWAADEYVANQFGGEDSVVDLSAPQTAPQDEPCEPSDRAGAQAADEPAAKAVEATTSKTAAKKAPTKKGSTRKAATPTTGTPSKELAKKKPSAEKPAAKQATSKKPAARKATTRKTGTQQTPAEAATPSETAEE